MNNLKTTLITFIIITALSANILAQGVAINESGASADASAILDVTSTTKGMLIPRMTATQRSAISSPATGLLLYQTDGTQGFYYNSGTPSTPNWILLSSALINQISDADGDTKVQVEESSDEDKIRFDVAGTEFFRMNSGRLEVLNTGNSVFIGEGAGTSDDLSNNQNTFIGKDAGNANTTGTRNIAIGSDALTNSTIGTDNSASGHNALAANTTGNFNTAMGSNALTANTIGASNTAVGYLALYTNNNGSNNIAIGSTALIFNTSGSDNNAMGINAIRNNTTGGSNIGIGSAVAYSNTSGSSNVNIGVGANYFNTTGNQNTILGSEAGVGSGSHSKSGNIFLGYRAGYNETSDNKLYIENSNSASPLIYGDFANDSVKINGHLTVTNGISGAISTLVDADNDTKIQVEESADEDIIRFDMAGTEFFRMHSGRLEVLNTGNSVFIGEGAGAVDDGTNNLGVFVGFEAGNSNTTGLGNVAVGYRTLKTNTTGGGNVAIGHEALISNTTGGENIGIGLWALQQNLTGSNNIGMGYNALSNNTTGTNNVAIGKEAMDDNTVGADNSALGYQALSSNTSGTRNTAVGNNSLLSSTTSNDNTAMGDQAMRSNTTGYSNTAMGQRALYSNTTGFNNTSFGYTAQYFNTTGNSNVALGYEANLYNQTGSQNTIIGYQSGRSLFRHSKQGNIFIGYNAGYNDTTDNKLYIENSNSATPLIYGDFANDSVKIYGTLNVNDAFSFPTTDGTNGQVLKSNGSGILTWAEETTDNLGNHTATQNIQMDNNWLSNDGGNEGIRIDNSGHVGIGGAPGTVGGGVLEMQGTVSSIAEGPHLQVVTSSDVYPVFQQRNYAHDDIALTFDAYSDGASSWKSSYANSSYQLHKTSDQLQFNYSVGNTLGGAVTFNKAMVIDTDGNIGIGVDNPTSRFHVADSTASVNETMVVELQNKSETNSNSIQLLFRHGSGGGKYTRLRSLDRGSNGSSFGITTVANIPGGSSSAQERISIDKTGYVGIGVIEPGYLFQVGMNGDGSEARANAWNTFSDRRWKTDFVVIPDALEKLNQINGYTFKWKDKPDTTTQVGVIAQEIEAVLPQVVSTDPKGYKSVDYSKLTALLIEGSKELHRQVETLQQELLDLEEENLELRNQQTSINAEQQAAIETLQQQLKELLFHAAVVQE
jgi:trimeric autotransporter adhesin